MYIGQEVSQDCIVLHAFICLIGLKVWPLLSLDQSSYSVGYHILKFFLHF